jgi:hypothetical protein
MQCLPHSVDEASGERLSLEGYSGGSKNFIAESHAWQLPEMFQTIVWLMTEVCSC